MLVVKIEVWPRNQTKEAYEVGRAYIWNDGSGTVERGNYRVAVMAKPEAGPFRNHFSCRDIEKEARLKGRVTGAARGQANLWPLVRKALKAAQVRAHRPQPRLKKR